MRHDERGSMRGAVKEMESRAVGEIRGTSGKLSEGKC